MRSYKLGEGESLMSRSPYGFLLHTLIFCFLLGGASLSPAGGPDQKGYGKSDVAPRDHCRHHHHCLKDPPRAPVANSIAAPQTVAASMSVVNPFASNRSELNPNVLRALAALMEEKADNAPQAGVTDPSQKGSASSALAAPPAADERDLDAEVIRLKDKLMSLEASIEKLNESTTRMLNALTDKE
jgi:hypothetical protein